MRLSSSTSGMQQTDSTVISRKLSTKASKARVDSIQAGSGAVFYLLPPENATGNFVKVVQRVPVKLVFEHGENAQHLLVPGMSAVPIISIR